MRPIAIVFTSMSIVAIGVLLFLVARKPDVQAEVRDTGKDIQRGARDVYNGTKDAAEDAKDAVKDATQ